MTMSKLYYTIGEVAAMLGENSSTLRFWEKEFQQLRPAKNGRGDRRYTNDDIALLQRIQQLTRQSGFTIDGAREQLRRNRTASETVSATPTDAVREQVTASLRQVREELVKLSEQV